MHYIMQNLEWTHTNYSYTQKYVFEKDGIW
jgi:hypothetical protein